MRLILVGAPGAGKGTYSKVLSGQFGLAPISTGDMLRRAVQAGTPLGKEAKAYMDSGRLVPDSTMIGLVAERLKAEDARAGFVLDGFPRTVAQAEGLEEVLNRAGMPLDAVLVVEVSLATLIKRLTNRRICSQCERNYNLLTMPPKKAGRCDACGGALTQRSDDRPEVIKKRFAVFEAETKPLIRHYTTRMRSRVRRVKSEGSVEAVMARIRTALKAVQGNGRRSR